MKTTSLVLLLAASGVARAATAVADFNDLTTGNLTGQAGGSGFTAANWINNSAATPEPDIDVVAADLSAPAGTNYAIAQSGTPQSAQNTTGTTSLQIRTLATPLTGSTIWFSFLINQPVATAGLNTGNRGGICFNQATTTGDPGNPRIMFLGTQLNAWLASNSEFTLNSAITPGTTALVLGRIQYSAAGNEVITLWVNPNVNALGAPAGTITSNWLGAAGITSVAVQSYGGGNGGIVDALRISDAPDAYTQVTGSTIPDPVLAVDPVSVAGDFAFGAIYPEPTTRTVVYRNEGPNNSLTVQNVSLSNDAGGVFTVDNVMPAVGSTLAPGESVSVRILANSAAGGAFTGELSIDTDQNSQDKSLPVSATVHAPGAKVNAANPTMDTGLANWTAAAAVSPGIAPGSTGMARVRGKGDKGVPLDEMDSLGQNGIPNGAANWELGCHFTPIRTADYEEYAIVPAMGEMQDRSFQLVVFAGDDVPATSMSQTQAQNALIQIAYLPAGNGTEGEGFYSHDGNAWVRLNGLPVIAGSIDADGDGRLVVGTDTVNDYRLNVRGTNFGSGPATWSVTLSGGELAAPVTQSGLGYSSGALISSAGPGSFSFTSSDLSTLSNSSAGFCTPFWVDDVFYYAGAMPEPSLSFAGTMNIVGFNQAAPNGTLTLRNDGRTQNLNLSGVSFGDAALSVVSPALPLVIPPGGSVSLVVQLDSASVAPDNAVLTTLSVASDDPSQPAAVFPVTARSTTTLNQLPNWNLETPGAGAADAFAFWTELDPTRTRAVPGILPGSATAAYLDSVGSTTTTLSQNLATPLADFDLLADFAIRQTANRAFNLLLNTSNGQINLRYEAGIWAAFNGTAWQTLIDMSATPLMASVDSTFDGDFLDAGESFTAYKLHITGSGWGTPAPSYQLEIQNAAGTVIASGASAFTVFQGAPTTAGLNSVNFTNQAGNNPGFWVDDVKLAAVVPGGELRITAFTVNKATGAVSITFTSTAGTAYTVKASNSVGAFVSQVAATTGSAGSTTVNFTDAAATTTERRFYRVETP